MQYSEEPLIKQITSEMVIEHITPCFKDDSAELKNLALVNKTFNGLFQSQYKIGLLLNYVATGNLDAAKKMLEKYPQLMFMKGSVIDPSGRHFKNISAFQLCLWTLDVHYMGGMMIDCIPKNKEGDKIREQLLDQFNKVTEKSINYIFKNTKIADSHFDFNPLINAMDTYIKNYSGWNDIKRKKYWCTVVGLVQSELPMHVRYQYCEINNLFSSNSTFNKDEIKRNLELYHYQNNEMVVWNSHLIGLGRDFGVLRGEWPTTCQCPPPLLVESDLGAIIQLRQIRIKELNLLKEHLIKSIQYQEQPGTLLI